jgi:hypothetical protein
LLARYPRDDRKLRARSRSAVHQAIKHSHACRLTESRPRFGKLRHPGAVLHL